MTLGGLMLPN